jgi:hypothetical protein
MQSQHRVESGVPQPVDSKWRKQKCSKRAAAIGYQSDPRRRVPRPTSLPAHKASGDAPRLWSGPSPPWEERLGEEGQTGHVLLKDQCSQKVTHRPKRVPNPTHPTYGATATFTDVEISSPHTKSNTELEPLLA